MKVLIIDRNLNPSVWADGLHWCDSSGTRSVWYFNPDEDSYETAQDLPNAVFEKIEWHVSNLRRNGCQVLLCIRREDPGLGIWIDEIDRPIFEAGGLPDGCIPKRSV